MPENGLYQMQGDILARHLESRRVTQGVRMDSLEDVRLSGEPLHQVANVRRPDRPSIQGCKKSVLPIEANRRPAFDPLFDNPERLSIESDFSRLAALGGQDRHCGRRRVDVFWHQAEAFIQPQSAAIKHDEDGPVANARRATRRASAK